MDEYIENVLYKELDSFFKDGIRNSEGVLELFITHEKHCVTTTNLYYNNNDNNNPTKLNINVLHGIMSDIDMFVFEFEFGSSLDLRDFLKQNHPFTKYGGKGYDYFSFKPINKDTIYQRFLYYIPTHIIQAEIRKEGLKWMTK